MGFDIFCTLREKIFYFDKTTRLIGDLAAMLQNGGVATIVGIQSVLNELRIRGGWKRKKIEDDGVGGAR